jgi:hypothetical protein
MHHAGYPALMPFAACLKVHAAPGHAECGLLGTAAVAPASRLCQASAADADAARR